jgi:ubiquinone biosynthesis protein UbiJ
MSPAGEVEAMHDDINRLRTEVTELTVRVDELEGRDRH